MVFYFKDTVNTTLIALRTTVDNLMREIDINKYKQQNGFAENFIENLVDNSEYSLLKIMPNEYRNDFYTTMDVEGDKTFQAFDQPEDGNSPFDPFTFNGFKIHIGEKDELNKLMFLFFDIVDNVDIELIIKDKEYHKINGIKNKHFILETTISYDDFLSENYFITLKVNGEEINKSILDLFKEHSRLQKN